MSFLFPQRRNRVARGVMIEPDEIFLDASNIPEFDRNRFQGRLEKPIAKSTIYFTALVFVVIAVVFSGKLFDLQVAKGQQFATLSQNNRLRYSLLFADRGVIYDRNGTILASNVSENTGSPFATRHYAPLSGLAHVLGYVKYPAKDSAGYYWNADLSGKDGVEKVYNDQLAGKNGVDIIEVDAFGHLQSHSTSIQPQDGSDLTLSLDANVTSALYGYIQSLAHDVGFQGGAGMIMNVQNGEVLAMTSYPEYDSNVMTSGTDAAAISGYVHDPAEPFLDRNTQGLYTPGSIVKPFIAVGALNEHIIDPLKKILSTGSISIPNPFDPAKQSVFKDWRPQGWIDMRQAIAVSSDVYFYEIGGGFQDQPGLGIDRLEKYLRLFGLGSTSANPFFAGPAGTIPDPAWKAANFTDTEWRVGDTYNTAIGQYGFQVTPMQMVRAMSAIANGGTLIEPTIIKEDQSSISGATKLPVSDPNYFEIVREGMRQGVTSPLGTASGLNIPEVAVAAKTGTAELGTVKKYVNSWVLGFFPYDHPRYAFVVMMEKGPYANTIGGLYVMRELLTWMSQNAPQYFK